MKTTIYVVLTYVDYEGSEMVKAFTTKEAAKEFERLCEEYQKTCRYMDNLDEWLDKHPAGKGSYSVDGYRVQSVELMQE